MKPKRAKRFETVDEQAVTAVLGETTVLLEPPPGQEAPPDSGDTVTMNVLVATSVDEMLTAAADGPGARAEPLPAETLLPTEDGESGTD